jgi:hypothetical protein
MTDTTTATATDTSSDTATGSSGTDTDATGVDTGTTSGTGEVVEAVQSEETEPQSKREARYRTQLRDTEAERDTLLTRVESLQRAEIERLAANVIAKPAGLWASDVAVADLVDDSGRVDPDKVKAAARAAQEELGLEVSPERYRRGTIVPQEGKLVDHRPIPSWEGAFKVK